MRKAITFVSLILLFCGFIGSSMAATFYVPDNYLGIYTIQDAINRCTNNNDIIHLRYGQWYEYASFYIYGKDNITITGAETEEGPPIIGRDGGYPINLNDANNITITFCEVRTEGSWVLVNWGSNLNINNNIIRGNGMGGGGIYINHCPNAYVRENIFYDCGTALTITDWDNLWHGESDHTDNTFYNSRYEDIYVEQTSGPSVYTQTRLWNNDHIDSYNRGISSHSVVNCDTHGNYIFSTPYPLNTYSGGQISYHQSHFVFCQDRCVGSGIYNMGLNTYWRCRDR